MAKWKTVENGWKNKKEKQKRPYEKPITKSVDIGRKSVDKKLLEKGIEPLTVHLQGGCSTIELLQRR